MTTPFALNTLTKTSYDIATEKGWWTGDRRSFAGLTDLMTSELSEALEDYRVNKRFDEIYFEYMGDETSCTFETWARAMADNSTVVGMYKPCGIPIELADCVIRICDFAGYADIDLESASRQIPKDIVPTYPIGDFEHAIGVASLQIAKAFELHLNGYSYTGGEQDASGRHESISMRLAAAIDALVKFCVENKVDLTQAIEIKTAFNRTRPARHGGKRI